MADVGLILDAMLMLLLVAALAFGVRLERKLSALRAGQAAFAGAVTDLNQAAARAEAALSSLRAAGQETDLLHDRIVQARRLKQELEGIVDKRGALPASPREGGRAATGWEGQGDPGRDSDRPAEPPPAVGSADTLPRGVKETAGGLLSPEQVQTFTPVLQALAANQAAQQRLNQARRSLDDDLFAA